MIFHNFFQKIFSDSYQRDENIDLKLFTLSALLSSTLIYNVMGAIDERALESLSFISTLSNQIMGFNSKTNNLAKYFPNLIWLIRDFTLDLTTKNKTEVFLS